MYYCVFKLLDLENKLGKKIAFAQYGKNTGKLLQYGKFTSKIASNMVSSIEISKAIKTELVTLLVLLVFQNKQ